MRRMRLGGRVEEGIRGNKLPRYLGTLDKCTASNDSADGWIYGSRVTYAYFGVYQIIDIIYHVMHVRVIVYSCKCM